MKSQEFPYEQPPRTGVPYQSEHRTDAFSIEFVDEFTQFDISRKPTGNVLALLARSDPSAKFWVYIT